MNKNHLVLFLSSKKSLLVASLPLVLLFVLFWFFGIFSAILSAQVSTNQTIHYSGRIVDSENLVVPDGSYTMRFSIYNHETASEGNLLFVEEYDGSLGCPQIITQNGRFSIYLGECDTLTPALLAEADLYLEVEFNDGTGGGYELFSPRRKISSTPSAFNALQLIDAGGSSNVLKISSGNLVFSGNGYFGLGIAPTERLHVSGNALITGTLAKGAGTFDIPHPDPDKQAEGWRLRHSFVESPTRGDNIYRFVVEVEAGQAVVSLPDYYRYLNENSQVWVSPLDNFGRGYGVVGEQGTELLIRADRDGAYNILVVATRKDEIALGFDKKGVEYQKEVTK